MKTIICNKIKESDARYFNIGWRVPYEELENIGWVAVDQSEIKGKITNFYMEKYNLLPNVVLFWNVNTFVQNNINEILDNNWTKCIYVDDLHQENSKVKAYRNMVFEKFEYVFSTYAYTISKFFPTIPPNKVVWFPHFIKNKFYVEFNDNPVRRISLTGIVEKNVYPFRYHIFKLSTKYSINVLQHPSYKKPIHTYYGHDYIKYLSKYVASITCCSTEKTPYVIAKFFEIPASGSLLMAYDEFVKEPLKQLGFVDGENYLSVNYDNIIDKISFVMDPNNTEEVNRIRRNGYDFVWKNHTLLDRIKIIEHTLNN
ncbi:MAG: hypothetical protein Satyrvirus33_8 [Satyrvirus sp.]|uniref:Spore protein YkvP/CgeB glycosyl transferase-like domain-containing protein n=1 Tax=Satyrvirus sp. TaxID=2487771 RepID=A0A3G5AF09_9VIRU|nr:MAG: hypothetical protein Satyrvirus33_8 [Satyrvirus sp.]